MDAAAETLSKASHKLAEAMYSKTRESQGGGAQPGADGAAGPQGGASNGGGAQPGAEGSKDDVVDADFKEVKE
jgi:molecular chaperone DnaK